MSIDKQTDIEAPYKADAVEGGNRFTIYKTIYAKRKGMSAEEVGEVFRVEAEYHLRKNPDLGFVKIGKAVDNSDGSKTFPLYFAPKPPSKQ